MYSVYLKKKEDRRIREGHPWVYANEVDRIEGEGKNGDICSVFDYSGNLLGKGFINHLSKILVRIFIRDDSLPNKEFFKERIKKANDYRVKLGYENCYRMVFAEADDLPALIIDKYSDVFCLQVLSLGMNNHKNDIVSALVELYSPRGIYERSDVEVRKKEGLPLTKGVLYGEFESVVEIEENGLSMIADLEKGQKTGYFLDQKENRLAVRKYCKDAEVLDCFCNVGGFSLNCAKGGAKKVTALDISEKALNDVNINAKKNGFEGIVQTKCADVFEALREYKKEGKKFDVVILDPPAFCKTASDVKNAYRGYKDINILGMKIVKSGGFLITASCSHYMTASLFEKMIGEASKESKQKVRIVEIKTQSPDHPSLVGASETTYLKFYVLNVL